MHKDVILNRICYDRVKVKEQTSHYQRLLEVKPTLDLKPPRPINKQHNINPYQNLQHGLDKKSALILTKKDRMIIDKNVEVQKDNRIMLQKLLEIDHRKSDLNKVRIESSLNQTEHEISCGGVKDYRLRKLNHFEKIERRQISDRSQVNRQRYEEDAEFIATAFTKCRTHSQASFPQRNQQQTER
eukprot:403368883